MKTYIIFFLLILSTFTRTALSEATSKNPNKMSRVLFCKNFNLKHLANHKTPYTKCFSHNLFKNKPYYKIYLHDNKIQKADYYNSMGILDRINIFTYKTDPLVSREKIMIYKSKTSKYLTYTFFKSILKPNSGSEEDNHREYTFVPVPIISRLNMHNGKSYELGYYKKIERYENNILTTVSYYDYENPNPTLSTNLTLDPLDARLLVKIFYQQQAISGYKIRRYKKIPQTLSQRYKKKKKYRKKKPRKYKKYIQEEYYDGDRHWVNILNKNETLEITSSSDPKLKGFFFSIYYYNNGSKNKRLLVKEDYYAKNINKNRFLKFLKSKSTHKSKKSLENRRKALERLLKTNLFKKKIQKRIFWFFRKGKEQMFLPEEENLYENLLTQVEYYTDNTLRKVESYDKKGDMKSVDHYNHFGEKIFDKE